MTEKLKLAAVEAIIRRYRSRIDHTATIPRAEYQRRWHAVQAELRRRNLDAGIFYFYREMPGDGLYLTGYNPTIERSCGVIGRTGCPVVIAGPEAGELARESARASGVMVRYAEEFQIPDEYYAHADFTPLRRIITKAAGQRRIRRIGWLTDPALFPMGIADKIHAAVGTNVESVNSADILFELRYEKSPSELKLMFNANRIANAAARAMLTNIRAGVRENQIAAVGDYVCKALGATSYGFETIVNSGPRCRTIIGPASNRMIRAGEMVQIGISPGYEGYKGVCRRVMIAGQPTPCQAAFLRHLTAAFNLSKAALKKVVARGGPPNVVDLAARNYFATVKLDGVSMDRLMNYSCVHGTGLTECMEGKPVTPSTTAPLGHRVGLMLDVGAYGHPNDSIAGGCIEDAFAKDGRRLIAMTDLPADVQPLLNRKSR